MGKPRRKGTTTLTRVYAEDVMDFKTEMQGIDSADVIRMAWRQYKAVQSAGKFIYGSFWKTPKKK